MEAMSAKVLTVLFENPTELTDQLSHVKMGAMVIPEPEPPAELLAEVTLHVRTLEGAIVVHGRVVQRTPRGIAVAFDDVKGARDRIEQLARATHASARGPARSFWGDSDPIPRETAPRTAPHSPVREAADRGAMMAQAPPSIAFASEAEEGFGIPDVLAAPPSTDFGPPPSFGFRDAPPSEETVGPITRRAAAPASGDGEEVTAAFYEQVKAMSAPDKIRLAMTGDRAARTVLLRDLNKNLQTFVLQNARITIDEVAYLAGYKQATPEALNQIAANRDWLKHARIVIALVRNPKSPQVTAIKLLDRVGVDELRRLAKSSDVPRPIAVAARKRLTNDDRG